MTNTASIGKNIKTVREEAGLTQKTVAEQAHITISQLSAYENGKQMPGLTTLGNLSTALNTSLDRLYFGTPSEAFFDTTENYGETVVNCFMKLRELGVVRNVSSGYGGDGKASLISCSYELQRLFSELQNYEMHKRFYPDGKKHQEQIRQSVANEINERRSSRVISTSAL